jgi:hypothetical protein
MTMGCALATNSFALGVTTCEILERVRELLDVSRNTGEDNNYHTF